jgi:hypothetical protein
VNRRFSSSCDKDLNMTQNDLNRAVARATGETIDRIQRMGFGLIIVPRHSARYSPVAGTRRRRARRRLHLPNRFLARTV